MRPAEYVHNISFRLNDNQIVAAEALRATFDPPSWSETFRWLFDSDEGRDLIRRRVAGEV